MANFCFMGNSSYYNNFEKKLDKLPGFLSNFHD